MGKIAIGVTKISFARTENKDMIIITIIAIVFIVIIDTVDNDSITIRGMRGIGILLTMIFYDKIFFTIRIGLNFDSTFFIRIDKFGFGQCNGFCSVLDNWKWVVPVHASMIICDKISEKVLRVRTNDVSHKIIKSYRTVFGTSAIITV